MATDRETVAYICEQAAGAGAVSARPMFGEYGLYCDGRVVGFVCDNSLLLKMTAGAVALLGDASVGKPYPGAKDYYLIDEGLEDADSLARLIAAIARDVPPPKPKSGPGKRKEKAAG